MSVRAEPIAPADRMISRRTPARDYAVLHARIGGMSRWWQRLPSNQKACRHGRGD